MVKKYNHHANHGTVPNDKANILGRDFEAETIHQKWCTDITYIHVLKEGWTYLACVMDLYSRKIIGYAYGLSMTAELAVEAVKNACLNVKKTQGILVHSDLGSQYTSQAFERYLNSRGMIHSFSRKGNPYDNACIESFHSVLKKEEIHLHTYQDSKERVRGGVRLSVPVYFVPGGGLDLCQYFEHKKLKGYADFFNSSSSFCCGVI